MFNKELEKHIEHKNEKPILCRIALKILVYISIILRTDMVFLSMFDVMVTDS